MSEGIPNPQAMAQEMAARHQRELQEARVGQWVDHTDEQSMADFNAVMERPEKADSYTADGANSTIEQETAGEKYEDMGMVELARRIGEARATGDKTKEGNITDVLMDKVAAFADKTGLNTKDKEGNAKIEAQDALLNRLVKVSDQVSDRIEKRRALFSKRDVTSRGEKGQLVADVDGLEPQELEDFVANQSDIALEAITEGDADTREKAINSAMAALERQAVLEEWDATKLQQHKDQFMADVDVTIRDAVSDEAEPEAEAEAEAAEAEEVPQTEAEIAASELQEPVTSLDPNSLWSRAGRIFGRARRALRNAPSRAGVAYSNTMHRTTEVVSNPEGRRGRLAAIVLLGAGATYLAYKGVSALMDGGGVEMPRGNSANGAPDVLGQNAGTHPLDLSDVADRAGRGASQASEAAQAWTDTVKSGDGITNSIMDYAKEHGKSLNPQKAFDVFNAAKENGLMDSVDVTNSASMNVTGGVGLVNPGGTTFSPDLIEFLNKELDIK